jgi:hypothetical protein
MFHDLIQDFDVAAIAERQGRALAAAGLPQPE